MERRLAAILTADVAGYSRLMGEDEAGTLDALKAHRAELVDPTIASHRGRVVKLMGDGVLVEFASVVSAVECAAAIQRGIAERNNASASEGKRLQLRIGINLGDVIVEGDDIYGDGVNVAARLQAMAAPGEICVSADVARCVEGRVALGLQDLGPQRFKNIDKPVHAFALRPGEDGAPVARAQTGAALRQDIRYCRARDGIQIAYASAGKGPPLLKAANWLSHLEYDWESPIWRHWFTELAGTHRLIRYDERGNGLSDWDIDDLSLEIFVQDLEAVVEAAGLERFPLLGISQGCAVSIVYAIRHPEKVSALVLYGGYAAGWRTRGNQAEIERRLALAQLIRLGWGQDNPAFRQVFTTLFVPGATDEQMDWFNEMERMSTSPENAVRLLEAFGGIDVRPLLPGVRTPTLVLHARRDASVPFEAGRELAKEIPGARFVPLDSDNHILLDGEPAWLRFLSEVRGFLADHQA